MIIIKVKQPTCREFPSGWAKFEYDDTTPRGRMIAEEHWHSIEIANRDRTQLGLPDQMAEWVENGETKKTIKEVD